jgi:hypothetical protein
MALALALALGYGFTATADTYPPACPTPGSGATGVAEWVAANCQEGQCVNPATTCNNEFTIELTGTETAGNLMTFNYKVCRIGGAAALSHWDFSTAGITCLGEGFKLKDLVVDLKVNGVSIPKDPDGTYDSLIGLDPTTQITGIKFEPVPKFGVGFCMTFSVTFDLSKLDANYTLGRGCVVAATKAGDQDIRPPQGKANPKDSPGYACIVGPVCVVDEEEEFCWTDETAWAAGSRYVKKGNWATYTSYEGVEKTVTLYAGQTMNAGSVHFSAPNNGKVTITVTLNNGWRFDPDTDESLKVQGYSTAPSGNPAPGLFADKKDCETSPCSIEVDQAAYYGVHVDVERQVPCQ